MLRVHRSKTSLFLTGSGFLCNISINRHQDASACGASAILLKHRCGEETDFSCLTTQKMSRSITRMPHLVSCSLVSVAANVPIGYKHFSI